MPDLSRRNFLKLASAAALTLSGLIGLRGLFRFLDTQTDPLPPTDFDLGPASGFAVGSRTIQPEIPAVVIRTASGFIALSLVCTHLGCTVESKPEGFTCPCHGSKFDPQGQVTRGPAQKPLRLLRTGFTADGRLHVYTD
jgi:cytochrome b6-f complex iron-sulfur subunit